MKDKDITESVFSFSLSLSEALLRLLKPVTEKQPMRNEDEAFFSLFFFIFLFIVYGGKPICMLSDRVPKSKTSDHNISKMGQTFNKCNYF